MTLEQTHVPYVQADGSIVRHGVCNTEDEKPAVGAPGSTIFVKQTATMYMRTEGLAWKDMSPPGGPHNHDIAYAGAGHVHEDTFPVGSVFITVENVSPSALLGYGTWVAFAAGRVLIGFDATQTEFDTVEETGGAKAVTLTTNEMPAHTHVQQRFPASTGGSIGHTVDTSMSGTQTTTAQTTTSTGGGGAHQNLPPYVVVFMWKRTA